MALVSKLVSGFSAVYIKLPMTFFTEIENNLLKVCKKEDPRYPKATWSQSSVAAMLIAIFQVDYRNIVSKTM